MVRRSDFVSVNRPPHPLSDALIGCLLAALLVPCVPAESLLDRKKLSPEVTRSLEEIRGEIILDHARVLCDPRHRGRAAGLQGVRKAAQYVATQFRTTGLLPGAGAGSHYQTFKIRMGYTLSSSLQARLGKSSLGEFVRGTDYMPLHIPGGKAEISGDCILIGYGITAPALKFDEYDRIDANGEIVLAFSGVPWDRKTSGWIRRQAGTKPFETLAYKAQNAAEHGAVCILIVENPTGWRERVDLSERLRIPDIDLPLKSPIPVVQVTRDFAARLTSFSREELRLIAAEIGLCRAPQSMLLRGRTMRLQVTVSGTARIGRNIVGIVPGRDERLRREAVVIGAHYDHLGEGDDGIFWGANDNAAGVGATLAVAKAFGLLPRPPRRTVIFVAFDAEEIGRVGSKHYISHPCVPINRTVMMVNFDMIGRNAPDGINVVGTRSSPELHEIHQRLNRHVGLNLTHPSEFRLGRSDHSPFYLAGVPIMYLFGGRDPDYNTPRDTCDKLIPAKMEKVARLAFLTALEVAEREARITFTRSTEQRPLFMPEGISTP